MRNVSLTWCALVLPLALFSQGCGSSADGDGSDGGTTSGGGGSSSGSASGSTNSGSGGTSDGNGSATGGGPSANCSVDLNCNPTPLPSTGDFSQDCVDRINQFRVGCHCLPPLERWTEAEACASAQAEADKISGEAHGSWGETGVCNQSSGDLNKDYSGWATNECPSWGSKTSIIEGCLASMYGEGKDWAAALGRDPTQSDYGPCGDDFNNCYVNYGHFIAMTSASYGKVACGITATGEFWSVQNYQ